MQGGDHTPGTGQTRIGSKPMPKEVLRLKTNMPAKPDWLCVNTCINFTLNQEDVKLLAAACTEIGDISTPFACVEVFFIGGRDVILVISA